MKTVIDREYQARVDQLVRMALDEDLGPGGDADADLTGAAVLDPAARCRGEILARAPGVVAGLDVAAQVFRTLDPDLRWEARWRDGDPVSAGTALAGLQGRARAVLAAERTALNFLGRMSGVATRTRALVDAAAPLGLAVLDTRKTVPGWRLLEKYAVRCGGGLNHRGGLHQGVMVKDNHKAVAGAGWPGRLARAELPQGAGRVVEVESEAELGAALEARATVVMFDNRGPEELARLAALARRLWAEAGLPVPVLEASGGMDLAGLAGAARAGVVRVSSGALTHSAPWLDVSLEVSPEVQVVP